MTLEIRQSRLTPEVERYLDSMSGQSWLSPAAHMACMLYGAEEPLAEITVPNIDRRKRPTDHEGLVQYFRENVVSHETMMKTRRRASLELERYAVTLINQLEPLRAGLLKSIGLAFILRERTSNLEFLVDWRVRDAVIGGCNAKKHKKPRLTCRGEIPGPQAKRLANPQRIKAYTRNEKMVHHLGRIFRILMTIEQDPQFNAAEMAAMEADFDRQMYAYRDEENQRWQAMIQDDREPAGQRGPNVQLKPGVRKKLREESKRRKKVMAKSVKIAGAILGDAPVRQFIAGKSIIIPGETVDFEVIRARSLAAIGHGGLRITLKAKESGCKLSGLCLYEEAPPLDQAATIALFCGAGDEGSLISAGNLYDIAPGADGHPLLRPKATRLIVAENEAAANLEAVILWEQEDERPRPEHWNNDRHIEMLVQLHRDRYGHIYAQELDRHLFRDMADGIHKAWDAGRIIEADAIPSFQTDIWRANQEVAAARAA